MALNKKNVCLLFLFCLINQLVYAATPSWIIEPEKSSITFIATQNGAPVTGSFKKFSGTIDFDPDKLGNNHVHIIIDMNSASASYGELVDTLKTPDWFDVKLFPQAVFDAKSFVKTGDKSYSANGNLTIRDKTLPVVLNFNLIGEAATNALVKGNTTLKRTAFGIGRGEWSSTKEVKDDVQVNFEVTARKK